MPRRVAIDRCWVPWVQAGLIAALSLSGLLWNTRIGSPPRFDGAGYSVLARSLLEGQGYRQIDHPDRPRHAHFPPGYPLALASLWKLTGPSGASAHLFAVLCTVSATLLTWLWLRTVYDSRTAWRLGLALACNWRWQRDGGAILSEPLFLLESAVALFLATRAAGRGDCRSAMALGVALGMGMLTRQVGVTLTAAVVIDLWRRGRFRSVMVTVLISSALVLPWIIWVSWARQPTQVSLLPKQGLAELVATQALFYARRLPDQVIGPIVEVGTVFRPGWTGAATLMALLASAIIAGGWIRALRKPRRRLAGLVPVMTLPLLLVWPFTEAGRFLVPLIPMILVGSVEGTSFLLMRWHRRRPYQWAAWFVLLASIPYSAYSAWSGRAEVQQQSQAAFDRACTWIVHHGDRPGPVLTRHPGEVFWQTGRQAVSPADDGPDAITRQVRQYRIAYFLIDEDRYVRAPTNPLSDYIARRPQLVRRVAVDFGPSVSVYEPGLDQVGESDPLESSH